MAESSDFIIVLFHPPLRCWWQVHNNCAIAEQLSWQRFKKLRQDKRTNSFSIRDSQPTFSVEFVLGSAKPCFSSSSGASGWWPSKRSLSCSRPLINVFFKCFSSPLPYEITTVWVWRQGSSGDHTCMHTNPLKWHHWSILSALRFCPLRSTQDVELAKKHWSFPALCIVVSVHGPFHFVVFFFKDYDFKPYGAYPFIVVPLFSLSQRPS